MALWRRLEMEPEMIVLIVFATVEGQTRKIARFAEKEARNAGYEVALLDVAGKLNPLSLERFDRVILAAPVHERRHPAAFEVFLAANRHELEARQTLLISVSLSAAFPEGLEDASEYAIEMKMRTGFTPGTETLVAGAVKTSTYDYFAAQVVRYVVLRGRDFEPGERDYEFTDWKALAATLSEFLATKVPSGQGGLPGNFGAGFN